MPGTGHPSRISLAKGAPNKSPFQKVTFRNVSSGHVLFHHPFEKDHVFREKVKNFAGRNDLFKNKTLPFPKYSDQKWFHVFGPK